MSDLMSKFMPIWKIETHFKCPVIGAVLSVEKHRQILKKCGYNINEMQPYEYHQQVMAKLYEKNNVSIKVNNYLRSKARKYMAAVQGKSEQEMRTLWKEQSLIGNVGPLMYALVSFEDSSIELLHDVYGEVHMQAHANMTQIYDIRQKLANADEAIVREKNKAVRKREEIKQLVETQKAGFEKIQCLEKENLEMEKTIQALTAHRAFDQGGKKTITHLEQKVTELESRLKLKDEKIRVTEREKRALQIEGFSIESEKELFENQMQALIDVFDTFGIQDSSENFLCSADNCSSEDCRKEKCARYQLCARRVFMIGGMTKMKPYYKGIVEKAGGRFDYHDGYLKSTAANLEARVKRSDLVICPVNCNSHNACIKVKKLCNTHNKQLKILSSSSLSAVTHALFKQEHEIILN